MAIEKRIIGGVIIEDDFDDNREPLWKHPGTARNVLQIRIFQSGRDTANHAVNFPAGLMLTAGKGSVAHKKILPG